MGTISGLSLKVQNITKRQLNSRPADSARMDSLLKITKIKDFNYLVDLRKFFNDIESCVRNLKSLKKETFYGYLLIPILKEKCEMT